METYFIVTNLFLTNITWINDWYWPMIEESILKIIFFISKLFQHHYSTLTNDWDNEWKICPSSKWNYFFLFRNYYSIISAPSPMTGMMNERYVHPQNEIIFFYFKTIIASFKHLDQWMIDISILKMKLFFLFRNYYSIISAPWPMTDIKKHEY